MKLAPCQHDDFLKLIRWLQGRAAADATCDPCEHNTLYDGLRAVLEPAISLVKFIEKSMDGSKQEE